jgi:hypothetical protein
MKFKWTLRCKQAFNNLKYCFITALILAHFDPNFKCVIKTDLSNYILGGVLSQYNKNSKLCLVAFLF